jgi:hypothetical protein
MCGRAQKLDRQSKKAAKSINAREADYLAFRTGRIEYERKGCSVKMSKNKRARQREIQEVRDAGRVRDAERADLDLPPRHATGENAQKWPLVVMGAGYGKPSNGRGPVLQAVSDST